MKSFEDAWQSMVKYAESNPMIETLSYRQINDIEASDATKIVVRSRVKRSTGSRILLKKDFRFAWKLLSRKKLLYLDDLEPNLRRRKSIVMAFLSKVDGVSFSTKPLRLKLIPNSKRPGFTYQSSP